MTTEQRAILLAAREAAAVVAGHLDSLADELPRGQVARLIRALATEQRTLTLALVALEQAGACPHEQILSAGHQAQGEHR